nr:MAG TPA: exodeoxyribonuclease VIII [Caudoviricetes sp.]
MRTIFVRSRKWCRRYTLKGGGRCIKIIQEI